MSPHECHDYVQVSQYRHESAISKLFPNESATRTVLVDASGAAYIYNPTNDAMLPIPRFPASSAVTVLWDAADTAVFVAADGRSFSVYVYAAHTLHGPTVNLVQTVNKVMIAHNDR